MRTHARLAVIVSLSLLSMNCNPFGCDEESETIEVNTAFPELAKIALGFIQEYQKRGYDCDPTDISGTRTLYECTKCD